ncbi:MAG: ArnT family glycosyltransferase [Phototrophicaceae bacterium]
MSAQNQRTTQAPFLRWIFWGLMGLALGLLLFHLSVYIAYTVNLVNFPFDYDQGEGFELVDVQLFSQGKFPYQDTEVYPFYSSNYPPLFHLIPVPLMWLFGVDYGYARVLASLITALTAGLIGYAVYRDGGRNRWLAVLSGLAYLGSNTIYHIAPLFRQHFSMILFEVAAAVILAGAVTQTRPAARWRGIALGLLMLLCAGYTKQLAVWTAVGLLIFLLVRNPRRAILAGAIFALVGGAIFAWLYFGSNGEWWKQAIAANINEYIPTQMTGLLRVWWQLHWALIVPAVIYIAYEVYFERISAYSVLFLFSLPNVFAAGKWGAGDSYYATTIAATCILAGLCLARLWRGDFQLGRWLAGQRVWHPALMLLIPALFLAYGVSTVKLPTNIPVYREIAQLLNLTPNAPRHLAPKTFYDSAGREVGGYADIGHFTTPEDATAGWQLVELLRTTELPVITEDASFSLLAGKQVVTNPTQLRNLWLNGMFEGDALYAMVLNQEFGFIVYRAAFYPQDFLNAVATAYIVDDSASIRMNGFNYVVFRPNPDYPPEDVP